LIAKRTQRFIKGRKTFVKTAPAKLKPKGNTAKTSNFVHPLQFQENLDTIRPHCVNALTVSVNSSGKGRLILDLRHVNSFVEKQKNKFELF
jgi:hypothetical protein